MSGAFYLVERCDELAEFFEPDKEIVFFDDADELADKAKYYLAHDAERERIRQAGMRRAQCRAHVAAAFRDRVPADGLEGRRGVERSGTFLPRPVLRERADHSKTASSAGFRNPAQKAITHKPCESSPKARRPTPTIPPAISSSAGSRIGPATSGSPRGISILKPVRPLRGREDRLPRPGGAKPLLLHRPGVQSARVRGFLPTHLHPLPLHRRVAEPAAGEDRRTPVFFPFNEQYIPERREKAFDVIYTGHLVAPAVSRLVDAIAPFNSGSSRSRTTRG